MFLLTIAQLSHRNTQNFYKDPTRGDVSFAIMMEEKADAEEREANPKAGDEPGCPGCKNVSQKIKRCRGHSSSFIPLTSTITLRIRSKSCV